MTIKMKMKTRMTPTKTMKMKMNKVAKMFNPHKVNLQVMENNRQIRIKMMMLLM